jgi:hypothetical protein
VKVRFQFLGLPPVRKTLLISEAAVSILLAGEPKMRVHRHEVNVQTLVSSTIVVGQAIASKIFKVYAPTLFVRRVGGKIMLGGGRPLADSSDVLSDLSGQIVYMMRVPGIILICAAGSGNSREFTAKQKAKRQRQGPDCHPYSRRRPARRLRGERHEDQPPKHDCARRKCKDEVEAIAQRV